MRARPPRSLDAPAPRCAPVALLGAALLGLGPGAGCDPPVETGPAPAGSPTSASPNASILPGPRADAPEDGTPSPAAAPADAGPRGLLLHSSGRLAKPEVGPPGTLRPDRPMPLDPLARGELAGVTITMTFRWRDVPAPHKAAEVSTEGIGKAAAATRLAWTADLGEEGRLRIALDSRAFALPPRSELRARDDRLGTVLLWPDGDRYRPIAPGALRALLGERRVDVTPLAPGTVQKEQAKAKLPKVPGLPEVNASEVHLESSMGTLELVMAQLPESGRGALALCRVLVELAGIDPTSPVCRAGEAPLVARYAWKGGGGFDLETTSYTRRADLSPAAMAVPPPSSRYTVDGLPEVPFGVFLTKEDLAAFRTKPVVAPRGADAPGEGFFAENQTDLLLYLLLDGVPTVAVPPRETRYLVGPLAGTYVAQWRSFLGDHIEPAAPVALPARLRVGKSEVGKSEGATPPGEGSDPIP